MNKKLINPDTLSKPVGYTHVATTDGRRLIFVSGQVAFDTHGKIVGAGDLRAQAHQTYKNLLAALAAAGASAADVIKMNTYIVNYQPGDIAIIREVRAQYFDQKEPPASTLIGISALVAEGLLIEIEAVAALAA